MYFFVEGYTYLPALTGQSLEIIFHKIMVLAYDILSIKSIMYYTVGLPLDYIVKV